MAAVSVPSATWVPARRPPVACHESSCESRTARACSRRPSGGAETPDKGVAAPGARRESATTTAASAISITPRQTRWSGLRPRARFSIYPKERARGECAQNPHPRKPFLRDGVHLVSACRLPCCAFAARRTFELHLRCGRAPATRWARLSWCALRMFAVRVEPLSGTCQAMLRSSIPRWFTLTHDGTCAGTLGCRGVRSHHTFSRDRCSEI